MARQDKDKARPKRAGPGPYNAGPERAIHTSQAGQGRGRTTQADVRQWKKIQDDADANARKRRESHTGLQGPATREKSMQDSTRNGKAGQGKARQGQNHGRTVGLVQISYCRYILYSASAHTPSSRASWPATLGPTAERGCSSSPRSSLSHCI